MDEADCDAALFGDRTSWFDHEVKQHRARYKCALCTHGPVSAKGIRGHLQEIHGPYPDDQLQMLQDGGRQAIAEFKARDCPFCDDWAETLQKRSNPNAENPGREAFVSPDRFKRHVAAHQEQLAILALPRGPELQGTPGSGSVSASVSVDHSIPFPEEEPHTESDVVVQGDSWVRAGTPPEFAVYDIGSGSSKPPDTTSAARGSEEGRPRVAESGEEARFEVETKAAEEVETEIVKLKSIQELAGEKIVQMAREIKEEVARYERELEQAIIAKEKAVAEERELREQEREMKRLQEERERKQKESETKGDETKDEFIERIILEMQEEDALREKEQAMITARKKAEAEERKLREREREIERLKEERGRKLREQNELKLKTAEMVDKAEAEAEAAKAKYILNEKIGGRVEHMIRGIGGRSAP